MGMGKGCSRDLDSTMLFFSLLLTCCALLAEGSFSVKEIGRTGNNVSLICMGESDAEQNARWSFNGTTLADSPCYSQSHYSDAGTLVLTITPECEGMISCSSQNSMPDDSHGRRLYGKVLYIYNALCAIQCYVCNSEFCWLQHTLSLPMTVSL